MYEVIISNVITGQVHRHLTDSRDAARDYAERWLDGKREKATTAKSRRSQFSARDYRIEVEPREAPVTLPRVAAAA